MDRDPGIIRINSSLGDQVSRLDQLETRVWNARGRGLYFAPDIPHDLAESISGSVVLTLAYIATA